MKVKRITRVPNEDVYNMYVEKHNNFAINGGLIVHNCDAIRGFCIMRQRPASEYKPFRPDVFASIDTRRDILGGEVDNSYIGG